MNKEERTVQNKMLLDKVNEIVIENSISSKTEEVRNLSQQEIEELESFQTYFFPAVCFPKKKLILFDISKSVKWNKLKIIYDYFFVIESDDLKSSETLENLRIKKAEKDLNHLIGKSKQSFSRKEKIIEGMKKSLKYNYFTENQFSSLWSD